MDNKKHLQELMCNIDEIEKNLETERQELPFVMITTIDKVTFEEKARYVIIELLESDGKSDYIGIKVDEQEKLYYLLSTVETREVLHNIKKKLQNSKELLSSIQVIKPFEAECDKYEEKGIYRVSLLDYRTVVKNQMARTQFQKFCSANGINIRKEMRYSSDLFSFMVELNRKEDMEKLCHFEGIASVKKGIPII